MILRNSLRRILIAGLFLAIGAMFAAALAATTEMAASSPEDCAMCHEDRVATFRLNPHSALDSPELSSKAGAESSCVACHGDATQHLEEAGGEGTIFAFAESESAHAKTDACLACHADRHPGYPLTAHAKSGLDCTSCHSVHAEGNRLVKTSSDFEAFSGDSRNSSLCIECHSDVAARFDFNERHRLQEGVLECTSCHNPHERTRRMALGGFKQEECMNCHTDKGGPFVFEHGSVRAEGCTSCHSPHGSPNRHQLKFQNVAESCYSCHGLIPGFHSRFTLESQCTSCHSTIHGSNFDPFFLK